MWRTGSVVCGLVRVPIANLGLKAKSVKLIITRSAKMGCCWSIKNVAVSVANLVNNATCWSVNCHVYMGIAITIVTQNNANATQVGRVSSVRLIVAKSLANMVNAKMDNVYVRKGKVEQIVI